MKLFWFEVTKKAPKVDPLPTMIRDEVLKTRVALFDVRLEKESAVARELTLMSRLDRLLKEQAAEPSNLGLARVK